jgi:hypothetical protein
VLDAPARRTQSFVPEQNAASSRAVGADKDAVGSSSVRSRRAIERGSTVRRAVSDEFCALRFPVHRPGAAVKVHADFADDLAAAERTRRPWKVGALVSSQPSQNPSENHGYRFLRQVRHPSRAITANPIQPITGRSRTAHAHEGPGVLAFMRSAQSSPPSSSFSRSSCL